MEREPRSQGYLQKILGALARIASADKKTEYNVNQGEKGLRAQAVYLLNPNAIPHDVSRLEKDKGQKG